MIFTENDPLHRDVLLWFGSGLIGALFLRFGFIGEPIPLFAWLFIIAMGPMSFFLALVWILSKLPWDVKL